MFKINTSPVVSLLRVVFIKWATESFALDSISPLLFCYQSINVQAVYTYFYVIPSSDGSQKSLSACSSFYEMNFLDIQTDCKVDDKVPIYKDKVFGKYAGKTCPSASQVSKAEILKANVLYLWGFSSLYWVWGHHHSSLIRSVLFPLPCPKLA